MDGARRGARRRRSSSARRETLAALAPAFAERAGELGLPDGAARLRRGAADRRRRSRRGSRATSSAARPGSGRTSTTSLIASGDRDLRQFGSQGEQRLAVLSLLLAEAELLPTPPLLLLDDVLSELDLGRRRVLAERVAGMGQTMITATHASALPDRAGAGRGGGSLDPLGRRDPRRALALRPAGRHGRARRALAGRRSATAIARNAWPARIARDGTVHVNTADSVWAFELGQPRRARSPARSACRRLRFAPGPAARRPTPSPLERRVEADARRTTSGPARSPPRSRDEKLRESVQKAVSLSLARERGDRPI